MFLNSSLATIACSSSFVATSIIAGAVGIITGASFIIPKLIDRTSKKESVLTDDMDIGVNQIRAMLSCA